jgi:hypothetical protein
MTQETQMCQVLNDDDKEHRYGNGAEGLLWQETITPTSTEHVEISTESAKKSVRVCSHVQSTLNNTESCFKLEQLQLMLCLSDIKRTLAYTL